MSVLPTLDALRDGAAVVSLPMTVRFRGITDREVMLIRGPHGWGEFGPFPEYADGEASAWLASAIESAWQPWPRPLRAVVPVNATVPAVPAARVPEVLAAFPGARTAKVKVAERGQTPADDVARVAAVREQVPVVRVDANGGWSVGEAERALRALSADGPLEYAEQPCGTVGELVELRARGTGVPIAADESIRKADDPLRVVRAGGADIAVVKAAPLGGVRRLLAVAQQVGVPVVVSSAIDSAVGIGTGLAAAAALPDLVHACGLGTGGLLAEDVAPPRSWVPDGAGGLGLAVGRAEPDTDRLHALAAPPERRRWWLDRLARCHALLAAARSAG
ncbi:o-succinylbenzoate synthase [Tomitella fengzijianii]|uniref:o-succinylbenzoate synthase n=1 Tax=Tomitella fengzijianii TaxID=2597660 RepID=A0A516X7G7_9ACTN|nr:o-succinylbenzoate synthase [Tomitella fengzijianii]QDQ98990.1 O-succinylbenzoate synthase [Tomitella fengzijianii]